MILNNLTDEDLVAEAILANETAFDLICDRYGQQISNYLFRSVRNQQDVEDLVQDVFLAFFESLTSYDPTKGTVKHFIFGIARYKLYFYLREHGRFSKKISDGDEEYQNLISPENPHNTFEIKEFSLNVMNGLKKLSPKEEDIVSLKLAGFHFEEIVKIVGSTYLAVRTSSCRGMHSLKKYLARLGYSYEKK